MVGGGIGQWAIGLTTARRRRGTFRRTLQTLRNSGWKTDLVYVFAESGSARYWSRAGLGPVRVVRRIAPCSGAWASFFLGLAELYLRHPNADAYFMLQDDVEFVRGLKEYLEEKLWPATECGCVSLHTPRHLAAAGWRRILQGRIGLERLGCAGVYFPECIGAGAVVRLEGGRSPHAGCRRWVEECGFGRR